MDHGVYGLHDILPDKERLFPELLQEAGYATALFGKLHVSGRIVDSNQLHPHTGFDVYENALSPYNHDCRYHAYRDWLQANNPALLEQLQREGSSHGFIPEEAHFSTWVAERSAEFISSHSGGPPFFCCASFVDPHDPFDDHPEQFLQSVDEGALAGFDNQPVGYEVPDGVKREGEGGVLGCAADFTPEQIHRMRRSYFASVALLDKCVGKLVRSLDQNGLLQNTVILFTTDHGEMLGQRGFLGKGAYFYEACARVPLIARGPGFDPQGSRCPGFVQLRDIAATVLTAAGIEEEETLAAMRDSRALQGTEGRDFAVTLYRNSCINRQKVFWDPPILCSMIRHGSAKLTLYHTGGTGGEIQGELFDLASDPSELCNLWDDPGQQVLRANLLGMLANWIATEDYSCNGGGRGGQCFPPVKNWLKNNPIRIP
jgi:arylsulfatase A-like enzyme